ncbi:MAG: cell wall metabolism sensor histidine kinase WalK [Anaerolineae bacterium]|jgi:heavy metal sensor kinase|nr:cell wall metabolism sensor histidine kinase WalK [Anaerolineae bacterium]
MSIRTRLTLWYTGLLALTLLLLGILIYSVVGRILIVNLQERLVAQAEDVIAVIQQENDPMAVMLSARAKLPTSIDAFGSQYFVQIVQLNGRVAQLSENLRGQRLPVPSVLLQNLEAGRPRYMTVQAGDVRLHVASMPIPIGNQVVGVVEVAALMANIDDALAVVRRALLFGSVLALIFAAVGGSILARAALQPIKNVTETAQQITGTSDLSQRIPMGAVNDEVGQLTATVNDMLGRLETSFDTQQRLVADVSHELRTPLTTIQGNLDLLRRGAADDPTMRNESLAAIGNETARMRRLVNDLLLLAQADAGLQLQLQPVELDTLILDVYRQGQVISQNTGVRVRLGTEDQAVVLGDADRLRQLLLNLVDNAIKYTPSGGDVTLTLKREAGWVLVSVADTGCGIPEEDLPHIFERFYRADRSRARPGGAGLGLSIAKWVAEAHGGELEVESEVGQGTVFTLYLPEPGADDEEEA